MCAPCFKNRIKQQQLQQAKAVDQETPSVTEGTAKILVDQVKAAQSKQQRIQYKIVGGRWRRVAL